MHEADPSLTDGRGGGEPPVGWGGVGAQGQSESLCVREQPLMGLSLTPSLQSHPVLGQPNGATWSVFR